MSLGTKVHSIYNSMGVSATLNNAMICNQLVREGKKVYKLGFGQSPFPVLPECVKELQKHAFQKDYLHVQGLLELREAIAEFHNTQNNTQYTADEIFIAPGSKQTLLYAQNCLYNDLLVPSPCWVSHKNQANILQRHIEMIETTKENFYKPTPQQIQEGLKHVSCDNPILLLNYPNNPTGQTFLAEELEEISKISDNFLVLSDEIYGNVSFEDHVSISKFMPERTITSSGISKWMGAGGWRFGYMIIPESHPELKSAMNNYISESYSAVSAPIQHAVITAYKNFYTDSVQRYTHTQKRIFDTLQAHIVQMFRRVGIEVHESQGGFYIYPNFNNLREKLQNRGINNSEELCSQILKDTGVATLPSSCFGQDAEKELSFRLCYVDFDGDVALNEGYNSEVDLEFLKKYCGPTVEGCEKLAEWTGNL